MGRLATNIAAAAADADNMPPTEKLPSVSLIDALLPRRFASIGSPSSKDKPTDPNLGRKTYVTYYDVRKSKNGSKSIVAHKSASPSAASGNGTRLYKPNPSEFSAEEDAKLKELKDANTSWKDIAEQMNRQPQELKTRWGQIKPTINEQKPQQHGKGNGKGKQNQQPNQQGKKGGKPQTKEQQEAAAKKREERQKRREEAEKPVFLAPAPAPSTKPAPFPSNPQNPTPGSIRAAADAAGGDETRFTLREWLTLQSDSLFTISELQFLSELILRDQNQTWLRIASLFYDKTGRKVHPEDIREKFERMAGMG
ncbi:hypothetical protein KC349_g7247 [Hortaea werneckii]|nr:hypothetical protein KC349_g7247 [Hortaea werneckii]